MIRAEICDSRQESVTETTEHESRGKKIKPIPFQ
jgi:hypothetical protein